MSNVINQLYEFGPFRLVPADRLLLRSGQSISLPPKAFDILVVLIQRSGHLVDKQQLIESVWPGVFVEEGNISVMIHALRKALGTNRGDRKYIEIVAPGGEIVRGRGEIAAGDGEIVAGGVPIETRAGPIETRYGVIDSERGEIVARCLEVRKGSADTIPDSASIGTLLSAWFAACSPTAPRSLSLFSASDRCLSR